MANYVEHEIPGKSAFTKLQLKHAVTGKEAAAIADALSRIEKMTAGKPELPDFMPALNGLLDAMKKFATVNKTKHPKFIKAMDDEFGKPTKELLKNIELVATAPKAVRDWSRQAEAKFKSAVDLLPIQFDENNLAAIRKAMEEAANLASAAANQAQLILSKAGEVAEFRDAMTKIQTVKDEKNKVDRLMEGMIKARNFSIDPAKVKPAMVKCFNIMTGLARA